MPDRNPNPDDKTFVEEIAEHIDARQLLPSGAGVVVGVSGGADSAALLTALADLADRPERGYRVIAAHLNHGLRTDADADERFVVDLAARLGVHCITDRENVPAVAERTGEGFEQAARRCRYAFLTRTAEENVAGFVAVAHHADDNVETVLYRIARGTHLRGLAGMPVRRRLGGSDIVLIRPMLDLTRDRVEAYCRRAGIRWRTDHTNLDTRYRRNFIRHELLPLIRERLNPRADEAVARLACGAAEVADLLDRLADKLVDGATRERSDGRIVLATQTLAGADPAVLGWAIRSALERIGAGMRNVGSARLGELRELVYASSGAAVTLPDGCIARRGPDALVLERLPHPSPAPPQAETIALSRGGRTVLADGRTVECAVEAWSGDSEDAVRPTEGVELLDADRLRGRLTCRPRRDGDVFRPLGAPGRQSVSDFLTNLKVPSRRRDAVRCVCDELGVVYLAPLRIDDRVRVDADTRRVVRIRVSPPWPEEADA